MADRDRLLSEPVVYALNRMRYGRYSMVSTYSLLRILGKDGSINKHECIRIGRL